MNQLQKTRLALVHIPTQVYSLFLQPILFLLLHNPQRDADGEVIEPSRAWNYWLPFVNISITPNECSIVCPRDLAEELFAPLIAALNSSGAAGRGETTAAASLSAEDYSAIQIGGEGLEAGQRVLDLTSPLAMAGIPIFFLTSYYSDFIIVPYSTRTKVIRALEEQGFVFEASSDDGEAGQMTNPASPLLHPHHRHESSTSSFDFPPHPATPPPTSVSELQTKTFKLLARNAIAPTVDPSLHLVTCAGIKDAVAGNGYSEHHHSPGGGAANPTERALHHSLTLCLTAQPPPQFLSITLTDNESVSLTLEQRLLAFFPARGADVLLGHAGPPQVPITLDLRTLPLESTGIVCGVASRLTAGMRGRVGREFFNMSYLSTARAGHVIVYEDELEDAMEALRGVGIAQQ